MASYLSQPSYNTYVTNPYQAPNNQIMQFFASRNQLWDQQASVLKNTYQNYLGLKLGLEANQTKLDGLMQGVNEGLKKSVRTDLSIGDNAAEAMKIFDPITKDKDIKYDNAYTKFVKGQLSTAQSLRTQDGGKYYNYANVSDMTKPYKDFVKENDPSKGRMAYANRRYYTPYHDVSVETKELYKNFKPSVEKLTRPETEEYVDKDGKTKTRYTNNGYLVAQENKSIIASQYRAYLNANLSDKAKEQLNINGRVAYGDDIKTIADDYYFDNKDKLLTYNREINELKGKKNAAVKSGRIKEADEYQLQIDEYEDDVEKLNSANSKIDVHDYSDVIKDKESIAASLYKSKWMDYVSKASARKDVEVKYSPDLKYLTELKIDMDNKNKNADRQMTWKVAQLNSATDLEVARMNNTSKKGKKVDANGDEILDLEPVFKTATEDDNLNQGKPVIDKMVTDAVDMKSNANDALIKYLTHKGIVDPKKSKEINNAAITEWQKNDPTNSHWKKYVEAFSVADANLASAQAVHEYVDKEVMKTNPKLFDRSGIKDIKPVSINGINITANDVQDALEGKSSKLKIVHGTPGVNSISASGNIPVNSGYTPNTYYINDKEIPSTYGKPGNILHDLIKTVEVKNYENIQAINKMKAALYDQAVTNLEGIQRIVDTPKESEILKSTQNVIYGKFANTGIKPDDITLTNINASGGVFFKINDTDDKVNKSLIKTTLESSNGKYKKQFEGGTYYLPNSEIGGFIKPKIFTDSRIEAMQNQVYYKLKAGSNNDVFDTTPIKFNNRDFKFTITNNNGIAMYEVIDIDSGASIINFSTGQPFTTIEQAAQVANDLSKLSKEKLQYYINSPELGNKPDYKIK